MRFLQVDGPVHWDVARQVARWVALEGAEEPTVDAAARSRLTEVSRAAEAHVLAETGEAPAGPVDLVGKAEWAEQSLVTMRPVLERLAVTLQGGLGAAGAPDAANLFGAGANPLAGMLGALGPLLLGVQCGFMVGQLGQALLGQHDLLLPVTGAPKPALIASNVEAFHGAWSIPPDDLRFFLAVQEAVRAGISARPWVGDLLVRLGCDYVGSFRVDPGALESQLESLDLNDPSSFEGLMRDPDALLGAMQSPEQLRILEQLQSTTAVLESYADTVVERIASPMVPSLELIHEAMHRHRVERSESDRFIQRLLGLDPSRRAHEMAAAFCAGVVERAGPGGLARLLESESFLPTPAEVEAPGLWLARLEVTDPGSV
ncbi:MAG TPA: zinc-dependent metalloprotease [Acidimicrobiia bacterium]|nr:zinc-dependent metalloprotease [Acidimicrobiia bacterium]